MHPHSKFVREPAGVQPRLKSPEFLRDSETGRFPAVRRTRPEKFEPLRHLIFGNGSIVGGKRADHRCLGLWPPAGGKRLARNRCAAARIGCADICQCAGPPANRAPAGQERSPAEPGEDEKTGDQSSHRSMTIYRHYCPYYGSGPPVPSRCSLRARIQPAGYTG